MKRKRFSEEQIIEILGLHQAGAKTADLCRQHGISEATLYNWRTRYGGLQVSEAKRLRSLEEENRKLKKLLAEAHLDISALKDIASGKVEACGAAAGGGPREAGPRIEPAPGLQADRDGCEQLPVSVAAARRRPFARATAHPGGCSSPVRLPAPWVATGAGGHEGEPEEGLSGVP